MLLTLPVAGRGPRVPVACLRDDETLAPTVSQLAGSDDRRDVEQKVLRCTTRGEPASRSRLPARPPSEVVWHRSNRPRTTRRSHKGGALLDRPLRSIATNRHLRSRPKGTHT
jgi:hypothetical protein